MSKTAKELLEEYKSLSREEQNKIWEIWIRETLKDMKERSRSK